MPGTRQIELKRRNAESLWATVDAADYDALMAAGPWYALEGGNTTYAQRYVRRSEGSDAPATMHRMLLPGAERVDHINHDGLDNRRANLRAATASENQFNRQGPNSNNKAGFLGVRKAGRRWRAEISANGRDRHLGYFDTPEAAARARDAAALMLHGQFAALNFSTADLVAQLRQRYAGGDS